MKFVVSSGTLLKQLSAISGVIASSPIVPILENFLFEIEKGKLTITASDLQMSMITELSIDTNTEGNIAVPARILVDTLKSLPEQPVTFSIDTDTYSVEISWDNGRSKLSGENASDFPKIPIGSRTYSVDLSSDVLARAINATVFAASTDELRPAMTGVFIKFSDTNTTFVATDGHRMVRMRRVDIASDADTSIIIPRKALDLLKKSLPSDNTAVKLEFNVSNAYFSFDNIKMICRLIDERFPDFENAIPAENPNVLVIDRAELVSSLKRVNIYANRTTNQVRFRLAGSELQMSAEDLDYSNEANERLACDYNGSDLEIGFNARFMVEMLSNMDTRDVKLRMSAPNRAGLLEPNKNVDNEDLLMLLMPVMLSNYA